MAVVDEAITSIKQMIVDGELQPGGRLPREPELAARLGLSRNSLREAVKALALVRVLDVRQGDGTFVTSLQPELLLENLNFMLDLHRDDSVLDFLEVRRMLEPEVTAKAALLITDFETGLMRDCVAAMRAADDAETLVTQDQAFHRVIFRAADNTVLSSLLEGMSTRTTRARVWRGITQAEAVERTIHEHEQIVDALERRQPDVAHAAARMHVAGVEAWVRRAIESGEDPAGPGDAAPE